MTRWVCAIPYGHWLHFFLYFSCFFFNLSSKKVVIIFCFYESYPHIEDYYTNPSGDLSGAGIFFCWVWGNLQGVKEEPCFGHVQCICSKIWLSCGRGRSRSFGSLTAELKQKAEPFWMTVAFQQQEKHQMFKLRIWGAFRKSTQERKDKDRMLTRSWLNCRSSEPVSHAKQCYFCVCVCVCVWSGFTTAWNTVQEEAPHEQRLRTENWRCVVEQPVGLVVCFFIYLFTPMFSGIPIIYFFLLLLLTLFTLPRWIRFLLSHPGTFRLK